MEFNLADLFESVVDRVGDQTAMVSGSRRLSYTELDRRANRLAHHLESAGVGSRDTVGLQLVNGTEYIESMLACFKIRAVPVNVNYRYLGSELEYLYGDAAARGPHRPWPFRPSRGRGSARHVRVPGRAAGV